MWLSFRGTVIGIVLLGLLVLVSLNVWPSPPIERTYFEQHVEPTPNSRRSVGFYHLWLPNDVTQIERLGKLLNIQLGIIAGSATLADTRTMCIKIISESEQLRNFAEGLVRLRLNLPWLGLEIEHVTTPMDTEAYTIDAVNAHCRYHNASADFVWYVHDKGAFHPTPENTKLMPEATGFALGAGCRDQVQNQGADICGMRWVRYPHAHFAASNMWLARCSYIARLPSVSEATIRRCRGESLIYPNGSLAFSCFPWVCGCDRFAPEHWIGLGSSFVRASDCLGYLTDPDGTIRTYYRDYLNLDFQDYGTNCTLAPKPELELAFEKGQIPDIPGYYNSENFYSYLVAKEMNFIVDKAHFY
jgi:hypothetical protein